MTALLLAPHHDDEALFASYLCLKHRPMVIVCTTPKVQERYGVFAAEREAETAAAMELFGCEWRQLSFLDTDFSMHHALKRYLELHRDHEGDPDVVFAPAYEENGHEQHNIVALAATDAFGDLVVPYLTYAGGSRSREGQLNEPDDPDWIGTKLQALSLYRSQLRVPNCRPWFYGLLDVREWLA